MFWLTFKRIVRSGLQNFFRNGFVSFSSLLVMTITLFIIVSVMLLGGFLRFSLDQVKEKVDVTVYFVTTAAEPDILAIEKSLEGLPEVASVTYTSRDDALAAFEARHANDSLTLSALGALGANPLEASLEIKAKNPSDYAGIAAFLDSGSSELLSADGSPVIDTVDYSENKAVIDKITNIIDSANQLGLWLAIIFIVVSVAVAFNTIRLIIFMARDEIAVMRLVGASQKYVKGPFVVSGVFAGTIAAFLTLTLSALITFAINHYYGSYFVGFDVFGYYLSHFFGILGVTLGAGILLGALGSYLAVEKYLKD
ncbi:MAG: ABC transporter permease [Patescibacteria group bacterium]|nr:ABC transporter permease [Patescibacteria group bacterium]MDE1945609.1 ABC transporter permease [Patescibacteria group bacterium]